MKPIALRHCLFALMLALSAAGSHAKEATPASADPVLEKRVLKLSEELRCLVCQNQTIADSHSELANDLRQQVREQLAAGKSDQEVIDYMVARYGDFVRYRPPLNPATLLLWFGPLLLLISGGGVLYYNLAKRRKLMADQPLDETDHQRVAELLNTNPGKKI
jgi:cytochrome c-type biogenesis protein CcmH